MGAHFMKLLILTSLVAIFITMHAKADNAQVQSYRKTYSAYVAPVIAPAATATDVCALAGASTALIRVLRAQVSPTQTNGGISTWQLVKRSTLNLAGTSVGITAVPHDSSSAAAVGSAKYWLANPTSVGTAVGNIRASRVLAPVGGTVGSDFSWEFDQNNSAETILLRGASEQVGLNFNGAAVPAGMSVGCGFTWSEE
jgi:hypothetical protein